MQVLYDEFCEILNKTPFLQNTSRRLLLFYYFTNKIVKNSPRKEKMETASKKNTDTQNKSLVTIYIKSLCPLSIQKFLYFSFLCFP